MFYVSTKVKNHYNGFALKLDIMDYSAGCICTVCPGSSDHPEKIF